MVSHLIFAFIKTVGLTSSSAIERNIMPHGFTKDEVQAGIRCLCLMELVDIVEAVTLDGRPQYIFS